MQQKPIEQSVLKPWLMLQVNLLWDTAIELLPKLSFFKTAAKMFDVATQSTKSVGWLATAACDFETYGTILWQLPVTVAARILAERKLSPGVWQVRWTVQLNFRLSLSYVTITLFRSETETSRQSWQNKFSVMQFIKSFEKMFNDERQKLVWNLIGPTTWRGFVQPKSCCRPIILWGRTLCRTVCLRKYQLHSTLSLIVEVLWVRCARFQLQACVYESKTRIAAVKQCNNKRIL